MNMVNFSTISFAYEDSPEWDKPIRWTKPATAEVGQNVVGEFFCPICTVVFRANEPLHCKDAEVVAFDPALHGRAIIPGNNAWQGLTSCLERDLKDDPLWEKAQRVTAEEGSASYVAVILTYIDLLQQTC